MEKFIEKLVARRLSSFANWETSMHSGFAFSTNKPRHYCEKCGLRTQSLQKQNRSMPKIDSC